MTKKDDFYSDIENENNNQFSNDVRVSKTLTNMDKMTLNDLEDPLTTSKTQVMPESLAKVISQSIQDNEENEEELDTPKERKNKMKKSHKKGCLFVFIILLLIIASIGWCVKNPGKLDPRISNIIKKGEKIVFASLYKSSNKENENFEEDFEENRDTLGSENSLDNIEEEKSNSPKIENLVDEENLKEQNNSEEITELEELIDIENDDFFQKDKEVAQEASTINEEVEENENINEENDEIDVTENNNEDENSEENEENSLSLELSLLAKQLDDIENGKFIDIEFDSEAPIQDEKIDIVPQKIETSEKVTDNNQNLDKVDLDEIGSRIQALIIKFGKSDDEARLLAALIQSQCKQYNLPTPLMTSIIAEGSSFKEDLESSSGRIGLLQISKDELNEIIKLSNNKIRNGDLKNPSYNLGTGLWYINYLKTQLNNDLKKAIIAKIMGINEFKKFENNNLPFSKKLQQRLEQIGVIYNLLTKNPVVAKTTSIADQTKEDKKVEQENDTSRSEIIDSPTAEVLEETEQDVKTRKIKKLNYKLAVKNILLAKDLPSILNWTIVPDDEISDMVQTVTTISKQYNFDPLFIAAIIMSESSFDSEIVSKNGKIGLLQISPEKAPEIAELLGIEWLGAEALKDPEYNLKLGVGFLNHCLQNHKNDFQGGMYAYNQGDDSKELDENAQALFNRYMENIKIYLKSWGGHLPK